MEAKLKRLLTDYKISKRDAKKAENNRKQSRLSLINHMIKINLSEKAPATYVKITEIL